MRLIAALVALVAVAAAWFALRIGLAHSDARPIHDLLVVAVRGEQPIDAATWRQADADLTRALGRHRAADLLELHGRTLLHGAETLPPDEARQWRQRAVSALREATQRRPTWPYAQANLATAKLAAGELDAELDTAINAARTYGPREPRVQRELAVLRTDPRLNSRTAVRAVLDDAFALVLADRPVQWIDRADRAGNGAWACSRPALPEGARTRCTQLGWLPAPPPRG